MSLRLEKRPTESTTDLQEENKDEITKTEEKNVSIKEQIRIWIKLLTVEPALFIYLVAYMLTQAAGDNLKFEMACRVNMGLNDTLCSNYTLGLNDTSVKLINVKAWNLKVTAVISGILVLCFSTFSDRYKLRKPFFVLPMFAEMLSCLGLILCTIFVKTWPVELYFFFALILPVCFGGGQTIVMAIHSYIADISTIEERTIRVGLVEIISLILTPIAPILGAILYSYIGYYGIYSISGVLFLSAALYGWFYIPEKREPIVRTKNICIDVFNIKAVVIDMFKILICKRIGYRRCLLLLTYICYIMIKAINAEGEAFKTYAGVQFKQDPVKFQYFLSFDLLIHILGLLLAVTILIKKLKVPDLILVVIACCFKIISSFWFAFASSLVMFYFGSLFSMFSGIYIIALRSIVTKLVSQSEVAKAQALFAICEMIQPLIYNLLYAYFFRVTKAQFLGAFFFLSAGLAIPPLIIALIMNAIYKNDPKEETTTANAESNTNQGQGVYNNGNDIETSKL